MVDAFVGCGLSTGDVFTGSKARLSTVDQQIQSDDAAVKALIQTSDNTLFLLKLDLKSAGHFLCFF